MQNLRLGGFNILPPVIKNLLIINGLFLLATYAIYNSMGIDLRDYLALYFPASDGFKPYQIITHMFMHGDFTHLFFNMFALWMFGNVLENYWGGKKFLIYYLLTGLGATAFYMSIHAVEYYTLLNSIPEDAISMVREEGLSHLLEGKNYVDPVKGRFNQVLNSSVLGASGAVFGILLAFGMTFPNMRIYLYFAIPIKAKYFVAAYGAIELINGITNSNDGIAHTAHLGGMIFGYILIKYWNRNQFRKY